MQDEPAADSDRIEQLTDRIDRLESVVAAQQEIIKEPRDSSTLGTWGRRGVLGSIAAALGLSAASGSAAAGVGQIGTSSNRVDIFADDIDSNSLTVDEVLDLVQNGDLDLDDNNLINVSSLEAEGATITKADQTAYAAPNNGDKQLLNFKFTVGNSAEDLLKLKNQDIGHAMVWGYVGNNDPPSHKVMTVNSYFPDEHYSVIDSFKKDNFHNQIADPVWDSNNKEWTISTTGDDTAGAGTLFITILTNYEVQKL